MTISSKTLELLSLTTNNLLKSNAINRFNFNATINNLLASRSASTKQLNQLANYYKNNQLERKDLHAYYRLAALFPLEIDFKPTSDTQLQSYLMYLSAIYFKNIDFTVDYKKVNDSRIWHQLFIHSLVFKKDNLEIRRELNKFPIITQKSVFEQMVQKYIYKLKVKNYQRQFTCDKTMYTFDYIVGNKVIEIQGPSHYVEIDGYRVLNMKTRLKLMIVKQFYDLETIEYFTWNSLNKQEKEEYVGRVFNKQ
ncbi:hypothetical protein HDV06_005054 [Boothiomyces sp. JEL0866]|nr:hypothetical protein HDV06_005054 [Boothiomyces sp. JEL0866]